MGGWISVDDRLPEEGVRVLVSSTDGVPVGVGAHWLASHRGTGGWSYEDGDDYPGVTHWRPLPPRATAAAVMEWVPVSERLPDEGVVVLINAPHSHSPEEPNLGFSYRDEKGKWCGEGSADNTWGCVVTHWAPISVPPLS